MESANANNWGKPSFSDGKSQKKEGGQHKLVSLSVVHNETWQVNIVYILIFRPGGGVKAPKIIFPNMVMLYIVGSVF